MNSEKITVRNTDSGKTMEVVVFSKRVEAIEVVIGEGMHSMKCLLKPTHTGQAYVGNIMGRELVYERSRDKVKADLDLANPNLRKPRAR
jgi:hypothetical protein